MIVDNSCVIYYYLLLFTIILLLFYYYFDYYFTIIFNCNYYFTIILLLFTIIFDNFQNNSNMTARISSFTSLTPNKPILYVLLIENVLEKLPADPVGAGTISQAYCLQKCILRRQLRTADWRMEKAA